MCHIPHSTYYVDSGQLNSLFREINQETIWNYLNTTTYQFFNKNLTRYISENKKTVLSMYYLSLLYLFTLDYILSQTGE